VAIDESTSALVRFDRANSFNGMLYEPGSFGGNGRGLARGRCCTRAEALGRMVGNTFHGHGRFGTYMLGDYFPKRTDQSVDANGLVTDRQTCSGFTADGASNGVPQPSAAAADSAAHDAFAYNPQRGARHRVACRMSQG
jgi:hypothetical protein